jgi:hypothetical protein
LPLPEKTLSGVPVRQSERSILGLDKFLSKAHHGEMSQGNPWDLLNATANTVTAISASLVFVQLRFARKTLKITTFEHLYSRMNNIHSMFIDHSELRAYFYDSMAIDGDRNHRAKISQAAEMIADFFEQVSLEFEHMPEDVAKGWKNYMRSLVDTSPALQKHLLDRQAWYPTEFMRRDLRYLARRLEAPQVGLRTSGQVNGDS